MYSRDPSKRSPVECRLHSDDLIININYYLLLKQNRIFMSLENFFSKHHLIVYKSMAK